MRSNLITPKKAMVVAAVGVVMSGFVLGVALAGSSNYGQELYVQAYNQDNLIRFHVIANSNSVRDQALKRKVRDLVVEYMNSKYNNVKNVDDARQLTLKHLAKIEDIAQKEVYRWGEQYKAKAVLGRFTFPEKTYGNITLPSGEYEAVRIILGKGEGANWWCVLFPPLCFLSGSSEMPPETLPSEMPPEMARRNEISQQYNISQQNNVQNETEIRVKFKLLELFKDDTSF